MLDFTKISISVRSSIDWLHSMSTMNKFITALIAIVAGTLFGNYIFFQFQSEKIFELRQDIREEKKERQNDRLSFEVYRANHERKDREKDSLHQKQIDNQQVIFNEFILRYAKEAKEAQKQAELKIERLTEKHIK